MNKMNKSVWLEKEVAIRRVKQVGVTFEEYVNIVKSNPDAIKGQGAVTLIDKEGLTSYILVDKAIWLSKVPYSIGQVSKMMYESIAKNLAHYPEIQPLSKKKFVHWKGEKAEVRMRRVYTLDFKEAYFYALRSFILSNVPNFPIDGICMTNNPVMKRARTSIPTVQIYSKMRCFNMLDTVSHILYINLRLLHKWLKELNCKPLSIYVDSIKFTGSFSNARLLLVERLLREWWRIEGLMDRYYNVVQPQSMVIEKPIMKLFYMPLRASVKVI